ncbi:MAG: hypothetical protein VW437_05035 [Betaproteobacteria bacterium]
MLIKKIFNYSLMVILYSYLTACSSVSSDTALKISSKQELVAGGGCIEAKSSADTFDQVKWARGILSPAVAVAATALAPVVLGVNAVLDYADHSNASKIKQACDLPPTAKEEMLKEVALNTGISIAIGTVDLGLGAEVSEVQQTFSVYSAD